VDGVAYLQARLDLAAATLRVTVCGGGCRSLDGMFRVLAGASDVLCLGGFCDVFTGGLIADALFDGLQQRRASRDSGIRFVKKGDDHNRMRLQPRSEGSEWRGGCGVWDGGEEGDGDGEVFDTRRSSFLR